MPATTSGTVRTLDIANSTMTLGNDTYYIRTPSNDIITGLTAGQRVEVTYVMEDGRRVATAIRKIEGTPAL